MPRDPDTEPSGPRHVAIIMDGNGRWAQARGRPRLFGHHAGAKRVREVVEACPALGVKFLTIFVKYPRLSLCQVFQDKSEGQNKGQDAKGCERG